MKICPRCSQTYADDSLNFCLNDGMVLSQTGDAAPPPTVLMNQPRETIPNQPFGTQPNQNWGVVTPNTAALPQRKKSRAWLWVLGIFGLVIFSCVGGFALLVAFVPDEKKTGNTSNYSNSTNTTKNYGTTLTDDLSTWKPKIEIYGNTDYANNVLTMSSKQSGFYYVLVTPKEDFKTENATTKITVKNTTEGSTTYGFGLLVHSNQKEPLKQDYALLIDSQKQRFRVARHSNRDEKTVVNWKNFSAIKKGTEENILEVRDENGKMSFYINGQLATEYTDSTGIKSGVAGLYVSDAVPIAFSGLEIRK